MNNALSSFEADNLTPPASRAAGHFDLFLDLILPLITVSYSFGGRGFM